jgi:hypothetical protein
MTEIVVAVFLAALFLGAIAACFWRIFLRLREIEETLLDEILATQEMVMDVLCEEKKIARSLNIAQEGNDEE